MTIRHPAGPLLLAFCLSACAIHHATPYVPDAANALQTAEGSDTGADCFEAATTVEHAVCGNPDLALGNRAMLRAFQQDLRAADVFARDSLLASQRVWLLGLPAQCQLEDPAAGPGPSAATCLHEALAARTSVLQAWRTPPVRPGGPGALAQYVVLRPAAGARAQPDPGFCAAFASRANAAIARDGALDPAALGAAEIAGTHGPEASAAERVTVDLTDANAYGLFQRRARGASLAGAAAITPVSLTQLVRAQSTANEGGRFSAFASQTNDYGSIDVFRDGGRLLVLAADPWGSTTPAAPGEAAHAGVWTLASPPTPVCLFDTYTRPAEPGAFAALENFAAWRALLGQIRENTSQPLPNAVRRDQAVLERDTAFTLLHMPLLAVQQANSGGWTPWLRHRHDEVLDALFAWSSRDPANKAVFERVFALLRPAAQELVHAYQATQGLSGPEATQAGGLAVMELLYGATLNIAPAIGSDLSGPAGAPPAKPRYPILASPQ